MSADSNDASPDLNGHDYYSKQYLGLKETLVKHLDNLNLREDLKKSHLALMTGYYKQLVLAEDETELTTSHQKIVAQINMLRGKTRLESTDELFRQVQDVRDEKSTRIGNGDEGLAKQKAEVRWQVAGAAVFGVGTFACPLLGAAATIAGAGVITGWNLLDNKKRHDEYRARDENSVNKNLRVIDEIDALHRGEQTQASEKQSYINGSRSLSYLGTAVAVVAFASVVAFPPAALPLAVGAAVLIGGSLMYQSAKLYNSFDKLNAKASAIKVEVQDHEQIVGEHVVGSTSEPSEQKQEEEDEAFSDSVRESLDSSLADEDDPLLAPMNVSTEEMFEELGGSFEESEEDIESNALIKKGSLQAKTLTTPKLEESDDDEDEEEDESFLRPGEG
jgi:hypothetical protein